MAPLGLNVPTPQFPVVGNNIPIAVAFMLHIAVASYSLGAIAIAPVMETRAVRRGDPLARRYAKSLANSYYLVFSLGATLAVFAVVFLIGLYGREFGDLVNVFLPLVGVIFGLFLLLTPLLVVYRNTFDTMPPRAHITLGFAVLALQVLFVVGISALDTYLITPNHAGFVDGARNAPYLPLVLHRIIASVSWTALFLAGFAAIRLARATDERERVFQAWAARVNIRIGLLTAVLMPIDGFALVEVLKNVQPGFFGNLVNGQAAYLFVIQEVLFAGVLVGGNIALALEMPRGERPDALGRGVIAVTAAGMVLGILPAQVLGSGIYWLRYLGIGAATVATLVHVASRTVPARAMPRLAVAPGAYAALPYTASPRSRQALVGAGVLALVLALFMGYLKEEARGSYSFYGELTQQQGQGPFNPNPSLYP